MGLQVPLVPIQILWLNLVTDGAPAVALAMELAEPGKERCFGCERGGGRDV